jgi:steroid 5-alpha reductase family enzyme
MSTAILTGIYLLATLLGWAVLQALPEAVLWQRVLAADVAATVFVWMCGVAFDNTSVYDPYWSVAPLPIAAYALAVSGWDLRVVLASTCLLLWGARLTWNFWRGWTGLSHEDWRYVAYRRFGTVPYWLLSLTGLMLMPTVLVFLGMLPVLAAAEAPSQLGLVDVLAALVALGALAIETRADEQLRAFRLSEPPAEAILDTGLWAWTRHPNYLGEVGFWWGIAGFGLAAGAPWTAVGALAITLLFWFISVPLIDRRMRERRPAYAAHAERVPRLFPFLPW